ncbi:MAG: PDZ domain-containing protein [Candidatus Nanoarchaeia archaeon]
MASIKSILLNYKVLLLLIALVCAIVALNPQPFAKGVVVENVVANSSAELNGITPGMHIISVNGKEIPNKEAFEALAATFTPNQTISLSTNKGEYVFLVEEKAGTPFLGFSVKSAPKTNLKQGIDLVGGARVLLKPEGSLSSQQLTDVINIIQKRLNTFGLQDISVRAVTDFSGQTYILVELAGTTQAQATKLISQQGKFEAKIGNDSVFSGTDIKQVCRSAECSGIWACNQIEDKTWACQFQFKVDISPEAAAKHAEITSKLSTIFVSGKAYLDKKLDLYLDDELVDSLYISADLKGIVTTSFVIEGSGIGQSQELAMKASLDNMKALQTILITGSLPVKMQIVKVDSVSPALGEAFFKTAMLALIVAIIAVGIIIFLRYRKPLLASAVFLTSMSEIVIILGVAALIKWNLDLPSIAGLLAAVGTGVDAQIIITDELLSGKALLGGWKERAKRALAIIFGSFATLAAAMVPLWIFGAAMLKGFAIVTLLGAAIGVFITRPAYSVIAEHLLKGKEI